MRDDAGSGCQGEEEWEGEQQQQQEGRCLSPEDIGVICFFRAQAALIHKMLNGGEVVGVENP